jgi:choline dehydrogenase-like flavoprotein
MAVASRFRPKTAAVGFDAIVIGAGAGGLAAAYKLTSAGKRVLVIEKGGRLRADDHGPERSTPLPASAYRCPEHWQDSTGKSFLPDEFSNVGGKTKWYGGALLRMSSEEFSADPSYRAFGWPISYKKFSRHYDEAENLFSPMHFSYATHLASIVSDICDDGRWKCDPIAMALHKDILNNSYAIKYFDGYASASAYKKDAENVFLTRIGSAPNFRMMTGVEVTALLHADTNPSHITGVACSDGTTWRARAVVAAAGAMRSPLLLQRHMSRSGLAGSHLIGAFFKKHLMSTVFVISLKANDDVMRKTSQFFSNDYPHSMSQCLAWFDGERIVRRLPNLVPRALAARVSARVTLFSIITEDGSHLSNAVRLSATGLPILDYSTSRLPEAENEHRRALRSFCWRLWRSGRVVLTRAVGLGGTGHAVGTLMTGRNPDGSVVDDAGRVHGMRGLYVADGSILPRSGRVNPALTIYAWGLRVGELLGASL